MNNDILIERLNPEPGICSILEDMYVERGTVEDWYQLQDLHYRAHGLPFGPTFYRCVTGSGQLVGVVIFSSPKLLLGPRHKVFKNLAPGEDSRLTNTHRANLVNKNFTVNSRTVVDTLFRGAGVAYRLLNVAARMRNKKYVEIQSSMSKYNPFAISAGFKFTTPEVNKKYEMTFKFMGQFFKSHPANVDGVVDELNAMTDEDHAAIMEELKEFYYKNSAMEKTGGAGNGTYKDSRVGEMSDRLLLQNMSQMAFASPMYGIYKNPDFGTTMPDRVKLLAFDNQKPNEKMVMNDG